MNFGTIASSDRPTCFVQQVRSKNPKDSIGSKIMSIIITKPMCMNYVDYQLHFSAISFHHLDRALLVQTESSQNGQHQKNNDTHDTVIIRDVNV